MADVVIGVGNATAQKRFIREHQAFIQEYTKIDLLLRKLFIRALSNPPEDEIKELERLPEFDPAVVAFENKMMADVQVFYLGRTAADDFGELCVLAGNGYGVGAYKILRGMYERIVTAAYIAKNSAEARVFAEHDAIEKWKLWEEFVSVMPEIRQRYSEQQIRGLKESAKVARAKRKKEKCGRCGQPITKEAWTRVTMKDMAEAVGSGLPEIYGSAYLEATFHSHPTAYGVGARLRKHEEGGHTFRESTEEEAHRALLLGHNLILRLLAHQNEYFGLGLEAEIQERMKMFPSVWDSKSGAGA